jgi:hypothetical protein
MGEKRTFTVEEKLTEVKRELALRRAVYPKMIAEGRLTINKASWCIDVMRAIERDYEEQAK